MSAGKEEAKAATTPEKEDTGPTVRQVPNDDFDHEAYITSYVGHTKVARLVFVADHCEALEVECLQMALEELKATSDTAKYRKLSARLSAFMGEDVTDVSWCDTVDRKSAQLQEKLELELNGYRTNLIKESIRMGYNDLGDFHYDRGDLQAAFKCYLRTRDYCTSSKHMLAMCLNVIKVSIEMRNFPTVTNYVTKAVNTSNWDDPVINAKLHCAAGLAYLSQSNYKGAARQFLDAHFDIGLSYNEVIAPQDVAVYGGLCALASFDRTELKRRVIDNPMFKQFLELAPEVRELVSDFYNSRYASCLNYLQRIKNNLLFDLHLHDHVDRLYEEVRKKALIQYFSPFLSVDLNRMAAAFNTDVNGVERELTRLIMDNQIQARIDSHNKILFARHDDQRSATFAKALAVGRDYQTNTKAMLLRINLKKADFVVRAPKRDRDGGGGGGGSGGGGAGSARA